MTDELEELRQNIIDKSLMLAAAATTEAGSAKSHLIDILMAGIEDGIDNCIVTARDAGRDSRLENIEGGVQSLAADLKERGSANKSDAEHRRFRERSAARMAQIGRKAR